MNEDINTLLNAAQMQLQNNKFVDALATYQKICALAPRNADAWFALGTIAGKIGEYDISEEAFLNASQLSTGFGKAHDSLIQVYELQSKFEQAISFLLQFQSSDDRPYDLDLRVGVLYGKNGDFEHAIASLQRYIKIDKSNAYSFYCLATSYEATGDFEAAEKQYAAAIELSPNDFQIIADYGALLQKMDRYDQAMQQFRLSISLNSSYPVSLYNAGTVSYLTGEYEAAIQYFLTVLRLQPDHFEAKVCLGKCYRAIGDNRTSSNYFKDALRQQPDNAEVLTNLGYNLLVDGDYEDASAYLSSALTVEPDDVGAKSALVMLNERRGNFDAAEDLLTELLETGLHKREIAIAYSIMCRHLGNCEEALKYIDVVLSDESMGPSESKLLRYNVGKIYDSLGRYDEAFLQYDTANRNEPHHHDVEHLRKSIENIQQIFTPESIREYSVDRDEGFAPIFILGMPRSGTSLLEQIVSCHHQVEGAGELSHLTNLSYQVWGDFMTGGNAIVSNAPMTRETFERLASDYRQLASNGLDADIITDKMPHNFRLIGLINILFPNAKILHCVRDPVDTCLSIYFSNFRESHSYANRLASIAEFYSDYYLTLMDYWGRISKIPIHNVNYEDLVNDKEQTTRAILEYCGLGWDEKCMNHHLSKRHVKTVSYDQVRKPVYKSSIKRWKNYEPHIRDLLEHFNYRDKG